ncbi:O-antigen ligase like membrane protein [Marinobacter sp. DSM 26671]|uniref:O-antigen ligase family protein n=1 Tax=Marinobacter sp. DSM 26671 TaxID=1761793 RepID=UPI0008F25143|nr:O-antigen ligase family protein [Marinobacter sp. DSM 26671]SFD90802.1 O-antigen ligase like membrane protein [Marinobacter sp. DSM 26671]
MGKIFLIFLLILTAFSLFFAPWVSGAAYFLNSLLQPQYLWDWVFAGIPVFKITAGMAIIGFLSLLAKKDLNWSVLKSNQSICLIIIWVWMHLSHAFTSYPDAPSAVPPELVLSTANSIFIMYFVLLGLCNNEKSLIYFCYIFVIVGLYYIYWSNSAYLSESWHMFRNNRLRGPLGSPYRDENALASLIVVCLPFILLLAFKVRNKMAKAITILAVPLTWHSLILFGSRGGLVATIIVIFGLAYIMKSKMVSLLIFSGFAVFMVYQGAILLDRTTETFSGDRIASEQPINPRIVSWGIALKLIPEYPVFGAGVEKYQAASHNHFPGTTSSVAHNTFFNLSVNTGLLTGLLFLAIIYMSVKRLFWIRAQKLDLNDVAFYSLASSSLSILGFFICSIFLDLIIFEPFYLALVINMVSWDIIQKRSLAQSPIS